MLINRWQSSIREKLCPNELKSFDWESFWIEQEHCLEPHDDLLDVFQELTFLFWFYTGLS